MDEEELRRSSRCQPQDAQLQWRFAREAMGSPELGVSRFTYDPGARIPWGHRHREQEEAYVVVAGSGRANGPDRRDDLAACVTDQKSRLSGRIGPPTLAQDGRLWRSAGRRRALASTRRMTPILLIHGGWIGPWCWDQFAGSLADRGHDVRAMRLRGHDQQPGRIWHRIEHYLDDVRHAAAGFGEPPVLVGHSMGGLLAQKHLERYPARGAVLLASVPTGGTASLVARLSARDAQGKPPTEPEAAG
jgi:pimeloyl-ACP methyl ester carboxylesterase